MPAVDLSQSAARQRKAGPADEAPEVVEAITAFIIFQKKNPEHPAGYEIVCTPNIDLPIKADRQPTHDEVLMFCDITRKDIIGQQYAGMAAGANLQMNQMIGQQLAAQQQVEQLGDLRL
jgi:hypothetical protein